VSRQLAATNAIASHPEFPVRNIVIPPVVDCAREARGEGICGDRSAQFALYPQLNGLQVPGFSNEKKLTCWTKRGFRDGENSRPFGQLNAAS
jgi:hypothetical protein